MALKPGDEPIQTLIPGDKPLSGAKRRLNSKKWGWVNPDVAIGMMAAGVPITKAARALDIPLNDLQIDLKHIPGATETISRLRERLKVEKITKLRQLEPKLLNRIEREVETGDAKDIDALFRAAHASEKIQASVAGESQKVDVRNLDTAPVADLKILIQNLISS